MVTLLLTANDAAGVANTTDPSGEEALVVAPGATVTLQLVSDRQLAKPEWLRDGMPFVPTTTGLKKDRLSATATFTFAGPRAATVTATSVVDGAAVTSNAVRIGPAPVASPRTSPAGSGVSEPVDDVLEPKVGEMDPVFAYVTLAVLGVFALVFLIIAWHTVASITLPQVNGVHHRAAYGSWSERIASIVSILALAVGTVVIFIGAWLGALETRGRLRQRTQTAKLFQSHAAGGLTSAELANLSDILDKASKLRGAIAVVVAGTLIVLCSLWSATSTAATPPAPEPTPHALHSVIA